MVTYFTAINCDFKVTYFTAINCDFKQHFRTELHVTYCCMRLACCCSPPRGLDPPGALPRVSRARVRPCNVWGRYRLVSGVGNMKLCSEMLLEVTVYCGKVRDQRGRRWAILDPALSARWAITNCMDGWYLVCSSYRVGAVGVARHLQNPFKYVLPAQPRGPGGV